MGEETSPTRKVRGRQRVSPTGPRGPEPQSRALCNFIQLPNKAAQFRCSFLLDRDVALSAQGDFILRI